MDSQKQTILVPTDFTTTAEYAMQHAVIYSKWLHKDITLLNIIKKEAEYNDAEKQILQIAQELASKNAVTVHTVIREGSIFTAIGEVANELEAEMVIMGTHGRHGVQKFVGSWALKVIVSAKAPFIVVQQPPKKNTIDRIVFPVDFKKENKEKIGWAVYIAKLFNSKIFVLKKSYKRDKGYIIGTLKNIAFVERYFRNKDVRYEITQAEQKQDFAEQTVKFAEKLNADLILIMTTKAIDYSDFILGVSEQNIIDNDAKIPVMCLNPRPTELGSFSATGN